MVEQARFNKALSDTLALSDAIRHDKAGLQHDFRTTLDRLLTRAQKAGTVRPDVRVVDVIALISGAAFGTQRHAEDPTVPTHVLTILKDGLRPHP